MREIPSEELDLYLLDYKESTEFNVYAAPPLPHAVLLPRKVILNMESPSYGILWVNWKLRARIFKSANARDFAEYRKLSRARDCPAFC